MPQTIFRRQDQVDSRLLVVGSQTANLTPDPSFAHNLSCRCPNGSCKAILDIYTSRTFQWHKEKPNAKCFDPEDSNFSFLEVWISSSHLTQSGVATFSPTRRKGQCPHWHLKLSFTIAITFFWILHHLLPTFVAWTLSQVILGVFKFPTLSWQVQEGFIENPLPMLRQKRIKVA
jgi:hypothetical protein